MKIRVLSDLHLEFTKYEPDELPPCGEDLVVLAGDIGTGTRGILWAQRAIRDRPVVYVLGNHEFYDEDWEGFIQKAGEVAAGSNVHVLENGRLDLQGLRILGCTLWTDFRSMGEMVRRDAIQVAEKEMVDFRAIRKQQRKRRLLAADTVVRCQASRQWLEQEIGSADRPLLVVTHHAPTMRTVSPAFCLNLSNAAFHSTFDELIRPPVRAWIHGHTHYSGGAEVNGVSVVSNQRGYPGERCVFDWGLCIEV